MFEGFARHRIPTSGGAIINTLVGGKGPALLLLHGYPQTMAMWHRVAQELARSFTVVLTDLRGYGDSEGPEPLPDGSNYRFRDMADDQVEVMRTLGHPRFFVAGHDRGARTVHRMALDHPDAVIRLAILDIQPTHHAWTKLSGFQARRGWFWILMAQPHDLAETLFTSVSADWLFDKLVPAGPHGQGTFAPEALAEYQRCLTPTMLRASCADYRAFATIDVAMDQVDVDAGRKVTMPTLVLWGELSYGTDDMLPLWRNYVETAEGHCVPGAGHYLPEERPAEIAASLTQFFAGEG